MDANTCRRINIRYLADHRYSRTRLAEDLGYSGTNYINQLCGGFGSFGSNAARKIEKHLNLPKGWMDQPHPDLYDIQELSKGLDISEEDVAALPQVIEGREERSAYDYPPTEPTNLHSLNGEELVEVVIAGLPSLSREGQKAILRALIDELS